MARVGGSASPRTGVAAALQPWVARVGGKVRPTCCFSAGKFGPYPFPRSDGFGYRGFGG